MMVDNRLSEVVKRLRFQFPLGLFHRDGARPDVFQQFPDLHFAYINYSFILPLRKPSKSSVI